jgi:hypothetical protein
MEKMKNFVRASTKCAVKYPNVSFSVGQYQENKILILYHRKTFRASAGAGER